MRYDERALVDRLSRLALFRGFRASDLTALAHSIEVVEFDPQTRLCTEGHYGDALYILDEGRMRVDKRVGHGFDEALSTVGPGAVVGEMTMLDGLPSSATVETLEPCRVFRLSRERLLMLRQNVPRATGQMIRSFCVMLCQRLRALNERIRVLKANPARLQRTLKAASQRARPEKRPSINIPTAKVEPYIPGGGADTASKVRFLRQLTLFRSMDERSLKVLAGILKVRLCTPGEVICEEGAQGDELFILGAGFVEVRKAVAGAQAKVLTTLPTGTLFGEVALIDGQQRSATCVACTGVGLLTLERMDFETLFTAYSPLANRFGEALAFDLSVRLRVAQGQFAAIFTPVVTDINSMDEDVALSQASDDLAMVEGQLHRSAFTSQELESVMELIIEDEP